MEAVLQREGVKLATGRRKRDQAFSEHVGNGKLNEIGFRLVRRAPPLVEPLVLVGDELDDPFLDLEGERAESRSCLPFVVHLTGASRREAHVDVARGWGVERIELQPHNVSTQPLLRLTKSR